MPWSRGLRIKAAANLKKICERPHPSPLDGFGLAPSQMSFSFLFFPFFVHRRTRLARQRQPLSQRGGPRSHDFSNRIKNQQSTAPSQYITLMYRFWPPPRRPNQRVIIPEHGNQRLPEVWSPSRPRRQVLYRVRRSFDHSTAGNSRSNTRTAPNPDSSTRTRTGRNRAALPRNLSRASLDF